MATKTIFRAAVMSDLTAVEAIIAAAYAIYVPRMGQRPAPMLADYGALIAAQQVTLAQMGQADEVVAGLIVAYAKTDHYFIETVAVSPEHQGVGLGRALLAAAEAAGRAAGFAEVRLYTNEKMTENLDYYPKLGYRETGRVQEAGFSRVYFSKKV